MGHWVASFFEEPDDCDKDLLKNGDPILKASCNAELYSICTESGDG